MSELSKRIYGRQDIKWHGRERRLVTGRLLATIESDGNWVGMFRIRLTSGHLSDMVNLTRARDAAIALALAGLNNQETGAGRPRMRYFREAAE